MMAKYPEKLEFDIMSMQIFGSGQGIDPKNCYGNENGLPERKGMLGKGLYFSESAAPAIPHAFSCAP